MTNEFNKNNKPDPTKFGGIIYFSDFNTNNNKRHSTSGSAIANRIASDMKFDVDCKKYVHKKFYLEKNKLF